MDLSEILAAADDQGKGRWFDLLHPVDGRPVAVKLRIAGPDSRVQAEAMALMTDELAEAAAFDGRVRGVDREECHRRFLARCVVDWQAAEGGKPVPFGFAAVVKLLSVAWVKAQVDTFAAARALYFKGGDDAET